MPKQIWSSGNFDSIVYTRTCDVIATPMCNCVCTWPSRRVVWRPIHGHSARQRPLRIVYLNLDLDLAILATTLVTNMDVVSHEESLWWYFTKSCQPFREMVFVLRSVLRYILGWKMLWRNLSKIVVMVIAVGRCPWRDRTFVKIVKFKYMLRVSIDVGAFKMDKLYSVAP